MAQALPIKFQEHLQVCVYLYVSVISFLLFFLKKKMNALCACVCVLIYVCSVKEISGDSFTLTLEKRKEKFFGMSSSIFFPFLSNLSSLLFPRPCFPIISPFIQLTSLGVSLDNVAFATLTMESDKFICIR